LLAVLTTSRTLPRWLANWAGLPVIDSASKA
jgi:hypothetical protein